jgi:hypothetical protein
MLGIIGFNLAKIEAERSPQVKGKISIKNNVQIKEIENADLFLGKSKQAGIRFSFEYISTYEPSAGKILLKGDLLAVEEEEKVKEIVSGWKKDKKISPEIMAQVINNVLSRCNIQAIILSREIALPAPVQLPRVQVKK